MCNIIFKYKSYSFRGENLMDSLTAAQLHCSYTGHKELSAFMILQPLKREEISLNPAITVFYDFVSDKEIEILKELAQPKVCKGYIPLFNI